MNEIYVKLVSKEDWESLDNFLLQRTISIQYNKLNDHFREYYFNLEEIKKLPHDILGYYILINDHKRCLYKKCEV